MSAPEVTYAYQASYISNHDGDTYDLRIDRGKLTHGIWDTPVWTVRLFAIDTWEVTGPNKVKGFLARDFARDVLVGASRIVVQTIHPALRPPELEKFGRVLVYVWANGQAMEDLLRANGHEKKIT